MTVFALAKWGAGTKSHKWELRERRDRTFVICAVRKVLSSFTAARGPLSPLGNVKGICKLLRYSANIV